MEKIIKILEIIKNFFTSNVITNVNVHVGKEIGKESTGAQENIHRTNLNGLQPERELKPPPTSVSPLPLNTNNPTENGVLYDGTANPIDEEALSELIAELKYQKKTGDKISVQLGKKKYDIDDI